MSLRTWPAGERPRERLLALGAGPLTDAELLALVVGAGSRSGGGALHLCRELLGRFEGLSGLRRAHPAELMDQPGIGQARACAVAASLELARRVDGGALVRGEPISCAEDVFRRIRPRLAGLQQEAFWVLALDAKHRLLGARQVAQGSVTSVEVHPREVFQPLVRESAAFVIVAHNHPSGDPEPSREDERLTARLQQAGEILGIPLLDHLVVGGRSYVSMAARGLLGSSTQNGRVCEAGPARKYSPTMTRRPRYLLEAAASLRPLEGGVEQPASVRDLSEWGLGLRGAGLRSPGEPLQVRFALPDGPAIRLIGAVVWARSIAGESRCGVRIQALPVADLLTLREHLEREAAGQPA